MHRFELPISLPNIDLDLYNLEQTGLLSFQDDILNWSAAVDFSLSGENQDVFHEVTIPSVRCFGNFHHRFRQR